MSKKNKIISNNGVDKQKNKKSKLGEFFKESYSVYLIVIGVLAAIGIVSVLFFDVDILTVVIAIPVILIVLFFVEYIIWNRANK